MATQNVQDDIFKTPFGCPPKAATTKRGSLPTIEISRANSKTSLISDLNPRRGSCHNILLARDKSDLTHTLSASNLAAISDSNLSIQEALPKRSYDAPNTPSYAAKVSFDKDVKKYFWQLVDGCKQESCKNKFCASSESPLKLDPGSTLTFSVHLASQVGKKHLCITHHGHIPPIPKEIFHKKDGENSVSTFPEMLFSCSPFRSFFIDRPAISTRPALRNRACASLTSSLENIPGSVSMQQNLLDRAQCRDKDFDLLRAPSLSRQLSNSTGNLPADLDLDPYSGISEHQLHSSHHLTYDLSQNSSLSDLSSIGDQVNFSNDDFLYFDDALNSSLNDSINEPHQFSLTHLNLPMLEVAVQKYKETDDPEFLLNTIRTVFTSSDALNNSFKIRESSNRSTGNIDLRSVRKAFDILLASSDVLRAPLMNAIEIQLSTLATRNIEPTDVNQVAILLEFPLLRRRRNHSLRQKLCTVIAALSNESRKELCKILLCYETDAFERRMGMFRDHFMLSLGANQRADIGIIAVAETLGVFYEANNLGEKILGLPIIPKRLFYVSDLGRKLDYKIEYENWYKSSTSNEGPSSIPSLLNYPFLLDPSSKVHALHLDAVMQMRKEYQEAILHRARVTQVQQMFFREASGFARLPNQVKAAMCPYLVLEIRRDNLIEDTLEQINLKSSDLKKPLKIKYVGGGEIGLDMGGLQKEYFQLLCREIFDRQYGMFIYNESTRMLWIDGSSMDNEAEFELVGIIIGLAIYNGVILDIQFPAAIYKKLQGLPVGFKDLEVVDPTLMRTLQDLLDYEGDVEDCFCQTFQISIEKYGEVIEVELIKGGAQVAVNNNNRDQFVELYAKYILTESIDRQFQAFYRGFHRVCDSRVLSLFQPEEIELLVCGSPDLDFKALERSAQYDDGYHSSHRVIRWFWHVAHEMTLEQKRLLLHFVTGSDRVPLKGLSHLSIIIQRSGGDTDRLPVAMTCFNRLLLPEYSNEEHLKNRLLLAIQNGKGFGLT